MLDLFRKRGLTSIVYGIIIVATILVFVINFRPNANQKSASLREACVANVRGFCVEPKAHRAAYRMLMPHDMSGNVLTERAKAMGLNKIALDGLVERELLINEAERLGLTVSEDEVNQAVIGGFIYISVPMENPRLVNSLGVRDGFIAADFRDKKTKQFDMKVYERNIRAYTGRSPTEYKEWQQRELLAAKMRDLIRAPIRVSEAEAFEMYVSEKSSATLGYVPVRFDWVEKYVIDASPKAAADWAKDKTNATQIKEAEIRHILIKTEAGDAGADSKDKARAKAEELIGRIKKGEDFAALAKQYSQDPGSAMNGGELGTKTDGFVKPFKDAADALKGGEMTDKPVESQFGFHIIKKDDPTLAAYKKAKSLDAAKDIAKQIQAAIASGKSADDAVKAAIQPYVKAAAPAKKDAPKADGDAGAPPPAKDDAPMTADTDPTRPQADTSSPFNKGGDPIPGLGMDGNSEVVKFAFSGAKDGELMKDPLRADDGFYVVQIKGQKAATKEDFDKERDVYLQGILAAKQIEALSLYVRRLREVAKPDIKIDDSYLTDGTAKGDGGAPAAPEEEGEEGP
jgi:peptidyl-prolyl cis-trans isomerase D